MKTKLFLSAIVFFMVLTAQAQEVNEHYIEVTGTSEIEIMPDKIHYIIEIREYFEEEFDGKSKPEEYHTKVPLSFTYLQPIITQYFIDNKSEIWLLFLIAHSKR